MAVYRRMVRPDDDRSAHRIDNDGRFIAAEWVAVAIDPALRLAVGARPDEPVAFRRLHLRAQAAVFFDLRFESAKTLAQD